MYNITRHAQAPVFAKLCTIGSTGLYTMRCGLSKAYFFQDTKAVIHYCLGICISQGTVLTATFAWLNRSEFLCQWCCSDCDARLSTA
jgi:hypothetical protein